MKEIQVELVDAILRKEFNSSYIYGGSYPLKFDELLNRAIKNLTKRKKQNIINKTVKNLLVPNEYWALQRSGMFWEFFPTFAGTLADDVEEFTKFWFERENKKGWIKLILDPVYED